MPIDARSSHEHLHQRLASSPAMEVALLNLSAEGCCILAKYGFSAPVGSFAQLFHDRGCIRATIVWNEAELAALLFDERLSETMFNRLAAAFLQQEGIAIGNPHSSKRDLTHLVSPEVKRARWKRWNTNPPHSRYILDLSTKSSKDSQNIELI